jgi:GTP-binding protein Era
VGKSTLMNAIVGQKVSIVSNKPQTTRRRVLGIATTAAYQIAFVDTPGVHAAHTRLDRAMLDAVRGAIDAVDVVVVVGEGGHHPGDLDREVAKMLGSGGKPVPVIVCINKMDQLKAEHVMPYVEAYQKLFGTEDVMLTTATRGINVGKLTDLIVSKLPVQPPMYDEDEVTDVSSRFLAGEFVRERILALTRQEVPYATAVVVDEWSTEPTGLVRISATILVEKASQRGILIGKGGEFLKRIGAEARAEIEAMVGGKVFLALHVKVEPDWRMNPRVLHELEYAE